MTTSKPTSEAFAGGDQQYLKTSQYGSTANLDARASLHLRYATAAQPWQPWLVEHIPWPSGGRILEVGCGSGTLWEHGQPQLGSSPLTVSDLSVGMVRASRDVRHRLAPNEPCTGVTSDAAALPYPDASFALVIANHMLYHLPDPIAGIAEIARVLQPDGVFVAATNGADHLDEVLSIQRSVFGGDAYDPHETVSVFGLENGAKKLAAGFGQVTLERFDDRLEVTEPADLMAYLLSYPPGEHADPDQVAALQAEVDRRFEAGAGRVTISKDVGLFTAQSPLR